MTTTRHPDRDRGRLDEDGFLSSSDHGAVKMENGKLWSLHRSKRYPVIPSVEKHDQGGKKPYIVCLIVPTSGSGEIC
jgi:hypothetical protein